MNSEHCCLSRILSDATAKQKQTNEPFSIPNKNVGLGVLSWGEATTILQGGHRLIEWSAPQICENTLFHWHFVNFHQEFNPECMRHEILSWHGRESSKWT